VFAVSCTRPATPESQVGSRKSGSDEPNLTEAEPPDSSETSFQEMPWGPREAGSLEVPGFLLAPLFVPSGGESTEPMRVVFFAHGAGGRGIDHCLFWDPYMPSDFVLVCPAGALLDRRNPEGGAYFPDHLKLR